ncbi:alpha/beta fold hydrolase [Candidatus Bathyarchaeota archaeon]|nr:alpha/beta fold hydrolase [Candidatus Bathyarchaeota archaeon]MBS7612655.1 alpha/beta fold hydrolase [Candidatus Bathyarchaeota archaeon]MBS7617238.1 alpha/beta fold hydrolase [Candidatus Bathyarchaeota archaeon]
MIKPVVFKNKSQELVGILHIPDNLKPEEKTPGIVMFHGFTGNKTEAHRLFVQVARSLCKSSFTVFRFDFRGSGDSDGEFEDMTLPGELDDAEAALTFLIRQKNVDEGRIGVIGLSMGGRVATILASKDERVKFAIFYSAALGPLRDRFLTHMDKEKLEKLNSGEAIEVSEGWYLRKSFFDTVDYVIPFKVMGKIKIPMLIIHGDRDLLIPLEEAEKGYEIIKSLNDKNELYVIKGGDHTFSKKEYTLEVISKTLSWLSLVV